MTTEYLQYALVSDQPGHALIQDPNLVNPWGIGLNPFSGDFWISDNATGVSTLYGGDAAGTPLVRSSLVVSIPGGQPTGQVANTTNDFTVSAGGSSASADFLFAGATGDLSGWNTNVPPPSPSSSAQLVSTTTGANFTGLALDQTGQQGNLLYAADFHNGTIDVFNSSFQRVTLSGSFTDPNLPAGFAPFNIENIAGRLFVTYAAQDATREHDLPGPGNGFVDVFDANGNLMSRLIVGQPGVSTSPLNSPWGLALAPTGFGGFSGDLLVANAGDGHINAFDPVSGAFLGAVLDPSGNPMSIDGLRGIAFGNGSSAGNTNVLFFTAGPNSHQHGLFGSIATIDGDPLDSVGAAFSANAGTPFNGVVATFSDINISGNFPVTINWGDGGVSAGTVTAIGSNRFLVNGSHTYSSTGSFNVTISIADSQSNTTVATSTAVVGTTSSGTLSATGIAVSMPEGTAFNGAIATFTDGDANTSAGAYSATIAWGDGTTTTGAISASGNGFQVTGQHTYNDEGNAPVIVTIRDSDGATATATSTAAITEADAFTGQLVLNGMTEGAARTVTVATFHDADSATLPSDFSATIDWGDGTITSGAISGGAGTFSVTGTHGYADEGTFTVRVTLTDDTPGTASATASATINVTDASLSATDVPVNSTEGVTFSGTVATFSDANPTATPGDFSATIRWGDGATTTGAVAANGSGGFNVTGQHAYAEGGSYLVDVSIADTGGSQASAIAPAIIADYPLTGSTVAITGTEGASFSGPVATFVDADPDGGNPSEYTVSVNWGDGATTAGGVTGSAGHYTVSGTHTFADESNGVTVTIRDGGGATATIHSPATITDSDVLTGTGLTLSTTEGQTLAAALATFTDANTANSAGDFSASIDWGDGTTSGGVVSGGTGSFTVIGSHIYADEGSHTARIVLSDDSPGTAKATATAPVTIADATLTASGVTFHPTEVATFNSVVATFTDANAAAPASDFTAQIDWGDGTTTAGSVVAAGGGTFNVIGSHLFGEEGTSAQVSVAIHDIGGSNATAASTAAVIDAPLNVAAVNLNGMEQSVPTAMTVAMFTDSGPIDPLGDYSAVIDWGGGTTSTGTISLNGATFTVSGSHTYSDEGHFTVSVTASEAGGGTGSGQSTATILEELLSNGTRGTPDERWVNEVFHDLLARQADPGALAFFGNLAAAGGRQQIIGTIQNSTEYRTDQVDSLYEHYLHRAADPAGQAFFVSFLQGGHTVEQIATILAASPEYFASRGSDSNDGFLDALFHDALGRSVDPGARRFFDQALAAGETRGQVAAAIFSSDEYLSQVVSGIYEQLLERPVDPGGLAFWVAQLRQGAHDEQIVSGVAASGEYFAKTTA